VVAQIFFGTFDLFTVVLLAVGFLLLIALGSRGADRRSDRPHLIYLLAVTFIGVFIALFGLFRLGSAMVQGLFGDSDGYPYTYPLSDAPAYLESEGSQSCYTDPGGSTVCSGTAEAPIAYANLQQGFGDRSGAVAAVLDAIVLLVGGGVLARLHATRALRLVSAPGFMEGEARRPYELYLYTTSFVSLMVLVGSAISGLGGLASLVTAPGLEFGVGRFVSFAFLALGASAVFRYHWLRVEALRAYEPPPPEPPRRRTRKPA
jgi:hypothetical protein